MWCFVRDYNWTTRGGNGDVLLIQYIRVNSRTCPLFGSHSLEKHLAQNPPLSRCLGWSTLLWFRFCFSAVIRIIIIRQKGRIWLNFLNYLEFVVNWIVCIVYVGELTNCQKSRKHFVNLYKSVPDTPPGEAPLMLFHIHGCEFWQYVKWQEWPPNKRKQSRRFAQLHFLWIIIAILTDLPH